MTISYFARSRGLLHRVSVVLWVAGFWLQTHRSLLAFWLLSWMSAHLDSETVQNPWMCQCTYCKDVYVGLICLRVIYLPKDHDVTLEISGEIYLKYVAFCLSLWRSLRLWTNTGRFLFLPVQYYCSNHSRAEPLSQQGHNLPQYKQQARHSLKSHTHTHHLQLCFTPHENYLYWSYCWPLLSLYNSQLLSILYHLLYLFFKPEYFTKPLTYDWRLVFQSAGACHPVRLELLNHHA